MVNKITKCLSTLFKLPIRLETCQIYRLCNLTLDRFSKQAKDLVHNVIAFPFALCQNNVPKPNEEC